MRKGRNPFSIIKYCIKKIESYNPIALHSLQPLDIAWMPVATVRALPLFSLISPCDGICISHLSVAEAPHHLPNSFTETRITQWQAFLLVLTDSLSLTAFSQSTALLINNFPCILFHILYMKSLCFILSRNISRDGLQHRRKKYYGCWLIFLKNQTHAQENKYQKTLKTSG